MNQRQPISIKATYTDKEGKTVEKIFPSLYSASKFFQISALQLKELSFGGNPKLHAEAPQDLKVERLPTTPKPSILSQGCSSIPGKWHCPICDKYIQPKSKYEHVYSITHKKKMEQAQQNNGGDVISS